MAENRDFEVIIIGGGINGAGIARDLALRGVRTLLLEQNDFGSGTTAYSTRLVHGGLRYLEHFDFGLVHESLYERQILLRIANHLVYAMPIMLPVYRGHRYGRVMLWLGMQLYDLLSWRKTLPRHRTLSRKQMLQEAPILNPDGLRGGFMYYDCQVPLPERLTLENILDAEANGAVCLNYTAVTAITPHPDRAGFRVQTLDKETGATVEYSAHVVINAGGPWVNQIAGLVDAQKPQLVGGTKGSHIIVANRFQLKHALYAPAVSDGRPFFVVPLNERDLLIGTTDIFVDGPPEVAQATADEIRYLISEANALCPDFDLHDADILLTYSGVRPLPPENRKRAGEISRKHFFYRHRLDGKKSTFISVVGGKITTYRHLAEEAGNLVVRLLGRKSIPASRDMTATRLLPGARETETDHYPESLQIFAERSQSPFLLYGVKGQEVAVLAQREPHLAEKLIDGQPEIAAQVVYAAEHEKVRHLSDFMLRRTLLGLKIGDLDAAATLGAKVAALLGSRLQWDEVRQGQEVAAYLAEIRQAFAWRL